MGTLRRMVKKPVVVSKTAPSVRHAPSHALTASVLSLQFSTDYIQLETEGRSSQADPGSVERRVTLLLCPGPELNTLEKVCLQASQLLSCEWCSVRKLPVLFFQTTEDECVRLRSQLNMSREEGGQWYDCAGDRKLRPRGRTGPLTPPGTFTGSPAPPRVR